MFNQKLIDAIVGNKDSSGCFIELGTRRRWSLGQGGLPWLLSSKFIVPPFSRCEELKSRSAKRAAILNCWLYSEKAATGGCTDGANHVLNHELSTLVAQWESDPLLFAPDQLLRRIEALDLVDRYLPEGCLPGAPDTVEAAQMRQRLNSLRASIEAANDRVYQDIRAQIRRGDQPESLLRWARLALKGESARKDAGNGYGFLDELISGVLSFEEPVDAPAEMEPELVAYQPTPARHIFDLIEAVDLTADDVLIDIGAGLGHVSLLVSICTPARSIGIEREAAYVDQARRCAERLNLGRVEFVQQDARAADLSAGTVFYLYTPFTGSVLRGVLDRLRQRASRGPIRVCSYGPCTPVLAHESWLEATTATTTRHVALFRSRIGA